MPRGSVFVTIAFVAGLALGLFAQSSGPGRLPRRIVRAEDLAAIEKLHRADIEATLPQDPAALTDLFSDDAVNLGFPTPAVERKAIHEAYEKFQSEHPDFKVLKYAPDINDVQIVDDWAIEVGNFAGTYKMSAKDNPVSIEDKGMRVLKRQGDGSWKFALVGLK
jgi:ketosteroid isomerase-like protein